jgi:pimeloyl-ACP methyl ester carboxylesterase
MSLGGTIAAYAAPRVAAELQQMNNVKMDRADVNFDGCLLLSPAVGVAAEAIPPPVVVNALSCLAWLAPSCAILTPEEDPSHYACPSWSTRNFKGQWPLGTSKLLLDITIDIVPNDISSVVVKTTSTAAFDGSNLSFHLPDGLEPYKILVLAGQKDQIVPMASIRRFVDSINGKSTNSSDQVVSNYACTLVEIPKGDHGLLARNKGKSVDRTLVEVKKFLNSF